MLHALHLSESIALTPPEHAESSNPESLRLKTVQGTEGTFQRNGDMLAQVLPVLICHAKSQLQVSPDLDLAASSLGLGKGEGPLRLLQLCQAHPYSS